MPTYLCYVPRDKFDSKQKQAIARAVTKRHSEATGAPPYYVQVFIEETRAERFLGGSPQPGPIWIRGDIRAGRTVEQRTTLMKAIVEDVSQITALPQADIWVYLCNLEPTDMIEYGHVLPMPGAEESWFSNLPEELQGYLKGLGTTKENFRL